MDVHEGGHRKNRLPVIVVSVVVLAAIAAAVAVVVKSSSRIRTPEVPVTLAPVPEDTALAGFRVGMRIRIEKLDRRYHKFADRGETLTPEQDSLGRACTAGFHELETMLARVDSVFTRRARAELRSSVNARYKSLVGDVARFARTFFAREEPELDSLDAELRRLLGE